MLTELHDDLPKVIWMFGPGEKSHVADLPLILWPAPEAVFLNVRNALHEKANCKKDHSCNISTRPEFGLLELRHIRRVQDRYWQRHGPNPEHLEDPKT